MRLIYYPLGGTEHNARGELILWLRATQNHTVPNSNEALLHYIPNHRPKYWGRRLMVNRITQTTGKMKVDDF